jgi:hypothetical protein
MRTQDAARTTIGASRIASSETEYYGLNRGEIFFWLKCATSVSFHPGSLTLATRQIRCEDIAHRLFVNLKHRSSHVSADGYMLVVLHE